MYQRAFILCLLACATQAMGQVHQESDALGDAVVRKTDVGADGLINGGGGLAPQVPDLLGYSIGRWAPVNAATDRYSGSWSDGGDFLRFDMTFDGLVNPPGPLALNSVSYNPFLYGPNPVFGYVEFDVDIDNNTGGEVSFPQHRYAGHAARFGGYPAGPRFADRVAVHGQQFDNNLPTPPFVERSGEEYHLSLNGDHITSVTPASTDVDAVFGPGESWLVNGRMLHRAHAFEPFSGANGSGKYEPDVQLRFKHDIASDTTMITLVFPLNQFGAAQIEGGTGGAVQPSDGSHFNHTSIQEGLDNLIASLAAIPPLDPRRLLAVFALVAGWENQNSEEFLNAHTWAVNIVAGTAYLSENDSAMLYAPTDVMPSPRFADFDGDKLVTPGDFAMFDGFIADHDGNGAVDAGAAGDGAVTLPGFGPNFCMFDLDYNGTIDESDRLQMPVMGDFDLDSDVDEVDVALFVVLLTGNSPVNPSDNDIIFRRADFNGDGAVDGRDIQGFVDQFMQG